MNKKTITVGPDQKPLPHSFYGDNYERGMDPWHADAFDGFSEDIKSQIRSISGAGPRRGGWFLLDAHGNEVSFVLDGTVQGVEEC